MGYAWTDCHLEQNIAEKNIKGGRYVYSKEIKSDILGHVRNRVAPKKILKKLHEDGFTSLPDIKSIRNKVLFIFNF